MKRANSGLTWINQEHVTAFLTELARTPLVSTTSSTNSPIAHPRIRPRTPGHPPDPAAQRRTTPPLHRLVR
ncbi:hypothetical protein ACETU7_06510 [Rhodococcus sp. 3Y1]